MGKYYITLENWQRIYSALQEISGIRVKDESTTYRFIEGVYLIMKTGSQWRELLSYYGKWRSIHKRYESWCSKGVWNQVLEIFSRAYDFENSNVIADKGYDSRTFIEQIERQHCTPVIPPRSNREDPRQYDNHLYKERHLVECFFNKIKHFRRIFSRFDKKASSFMGFLAYASIILWLR